MPEETSCKATRAIIQYIRNKAEEDGQEPDEAIDRLLANFPYPSQQNPYPEDFLADIDNWVELEASDALFERARILLRDEEITYKIAAATPQFKGLFGLTERLARMVGPEMAIRRTPRLQRALQRTSHLELRRATASQAEIKLTYHEPYRGNLGRDSCDFARGILSAVPQFAGARRPALLRETHCTIPIYKRGVINGYFHIEDGENYIWRFEWPFKEGEDQIPLPARFARQSAPP